MLQTARPPALELLGMSHVIVELLAALCAVHNCQESTQSFAPPLQDGMLL